MILSWKCSNFDNRYNMGWYFSVPGDFTIEPAIAVHLANGLYELRSKKHLGYILSYDFNALRDHAQDVYDRKTKWGHFGRNV